MISVIVPVYNTKEDELRMAIESILNQSYADLELLLINDGSVNNVEKVILSYKDSRIRYIKNDTNLKLIQTLNYGIELSQGEFIARLDADDYCTNERLEKQIKYLEKNPQVGLLGTSYKFVPSSIPSNIPLKSEDIKYTVRYLPGCILHSSVMFRKSVLIENNIKYDKNCLHAEDFKLWGDLSRVCEIAVLPDVLTFYRESPDGICSQNRKWQNKMLMIIVLDNLIKDFDCNKILMYSLLTKFVKNTPISNSEYNIIKNFLINTSNYINKHLSEEFQERIGVYFLAILNHFKHNYRKKIIWMP